MDWRGDAVIEQWGQLRIRRRRSGPRVLSGAWDSREKWAAKTMSGMEGEYAAGGGGSEYVGEFAAGTMGGAGATVPVPCVFAAFAAKTLPLPCVFHCLRG